MIKVLGYATTGAHSDLKPLSIDRESPSDNEVQIEILFCGVCHSDVHQARNEWKNTVYPCMPGHEIAGKVVRVGSAVKKFKVGDAVGVGCMIDSCLECENCKAGLEQYCKEGFLGTYNGNMRTPNEANLTYGGYSSTIIVREEFVLKIPDNLNLAAAAPLMCAGVTTFSPMRHWKVGKNMKVGIIGLGGLAHIAIKLAKALGADVTAITATPDKAAAAKKRGASAVILSTNKEDMEKNANTFDFILSTIPQPHDVNLYIPLLKTSGTLTVVGCIAPLTKPLDLSKMIPDRKILGTSLIGSIAETQEVLDFCSKHNIECDIKIIPIDMVNDTFNQLDRGEIDFRYVIDMATLAGKKEEDGLLDKVLKSD